MKVMLTVLATLAAPGIAKAQGPQPPPRGDEALRVASIRRIGLVRDSSKIDALIAEMKKPGHEDALFAAVRSLAQLGAVKGLDAINEVAIKNKNSELAYFSAVAIARIRADAASRSILDPAARATVKLDRFLRELGMDVNQLNARAKEDLHYAKFTRDGQTRIGIFALREIADMIYRESDAALFTVTKASGVDFKSDTASDIKILLAPVSPSGRLSWLINELANKSALRAEDGFLIQLAIDFGLAASRQAATKLNAMKTVNRDQYEYMGFAALFSVVRGVGDKEQASVVEPFLLHPVEWVRHYAKQTHPEIVSGTPRQNQIAY